MDHLKIKDLQGELRRLQRLGEKVILPKMRDLNKWKEDADQRLSFIENAQKLHRSQLGKIRNAVADELHSRAKKEIEKYHDV